MALALVCDIPLLMYSTVDVLFRMLWKGQFQVASPFHRLFVVSSVLLFCLGAALLAYTSLSLVIGIVGCISSLYVCIVLPCALYIKVVAGHTGKKLCWGLIAGMVPVAGLSFVCMLINAQ